MLKMLWPKSEQYDDVKTRLRTWTASILFFAGLLFYFLILPDKHMKAINTILGRIDSSKIVGVGITIVLIEFLGLVLILILEVHDRFYDRYLTRWRHNYDLDFILPTLVRPFTGKLDKRFFVFAQDNKYEFMKIFYHFVADREHEHKITENLIARFYDKITKYWITQINEIMLFLFMSLTFVYHFVYRSFKLPLDKIVITNFIIIFLFLLNRLFVQLIRKSLRRATTDEIENIHDRFQGQLEQEIKKVHEKFGLRYDED